MAKAGWYQAGHDPDALRFWNGSKWGEEVRPRSSFDAASGTPSAAPEQGGPRGWRRFLHWPLVTVPAVVGVLVALLTIGAVYSAQRGAGAGSTSASDGQATPVSLEQKCTDTVNGLLQQSADAMDQGYPGGLTLDSVVADLGTSLNTIYRSRAGIAFQDAQNTLSGLVVQGADAHAAMAGDQVQSQVHFFCYDEAGQFAHLTDKGFGGLQ